jgi:hypothetical protein
VAGPRHQLDGGRAAWAGSDSIYLYDGTSIHRIADTQGTVDGPYLAGGAVVWAASDGNDMEIFLHAGGKVSQLTSDAVDDRDPVTDGSRVFWRCGTKICLHEHGAIRELDSGECQPPVVDGRRAAWICDNRVVLHDQDGQAGQRRVSDGNARRAGLRLARGMLVWIEIAEEDVSATGRATLVFFDGQQSHEVADVGLGCMMCCALWPPLKVSFSGDLLAWSYPLKEGEEPDPGGGLYPALYAFTRVIPGAVTCP